MSHDAKVSAQFGATADRYRTSLIHAQGPDVSIFRDVAQRAHASNALDVGCGPGHVSLAIAPFCTHVHAADASAEMLRIVDEEAAKKGLSGALSTHLAQAADLPFQSESMDLVTCRYSAHHWQDVYMGVREMVRVMKRGGTFVLTDSVGQDAALADTHLQAIELLRDTSHVRNYRVAEWMAILAQNGLRPTHSDHFSVRIAFSDWVARSATPAERVAVIAQLQKEAPAEARESLHIEDDGSFTLQVMTVQCQKAAP